MHPFILPLLSAVRRPGNRDRKKQEQRFNSTLTTMLSAFINENHRNLDEQTPYVMMAYRGSEHETTGMSPNILMLGREVSTPLDLIFEMLSNITLLPDHECVWELRENLENAHTFVRLHTKRAINRQQLLHDKRN